MVAPPKPQQITLAEAVETYLTVATTQVTVGSLAASTSDNYAADLAEFTRIIGADTIVDHITGTDVDNALVTFGATPDQRYKHPDNKPTSGRGLNAQRRFHQSLSRFFTYATHNGWAQASPLQWATLKPRVRSGLRTARTALSAEQALALLEHGPGTSPSGPVRSHERNGERDRFVLSLLTILGPRVSELCAANLEDIRTDNGQVSWRIVGKGDQVRHVPLSPWLLERRDTYLATRPKPNQALTPQRRADAERALVVTGRGSRLTPRDVQRLLNRAQKRVLQRSPDQARDVTPHALRHTAATIMLSAGWDVKVVAQMLGHTSITTTGKYLDELPGELASAVAAHPLALG